MREAAFRDWNFCSSAWTNREWTVALLKKIRLFSLLLVLHFFSLVKIITFQALYINSEKHSFRVPSETRDCDKVLSMSVDAKSSSCERNQKNDAHCTKISASVTVWWCVWCMKVFYFSVDSFQGRWFLLIEKGEYLERTHSFWWEVNPQLVNISWCWNSTSWLSWTALAEVIGLHYNKQYRISDNTHSFNTFSIGLSVLKFPKENVYP